MSAASAALVGPPLEIVVTLRTTVAAGGLAGISGHARTKFLAKVASGVCKPDGLLLVAPDAELEFPTRSRSSACGASGR